eukprot:TRINITY_DN1392_c4_g1_i1.p3 TRINITY_DN1392_c4_g1~~TRINITY_DN1392_c4_g1_i1.p3  ORF type:complete len:112 (-),score=7.27 TRINITY_DN1392_c4_g1_i1:133-468(-)
MQTKKISTIMQKQKLQQGQAAIRNDTSQQQNQSFSFQQLCSSSTSSKSIRQQKFQVIILKQHSKLTLQKSLAKAQKIFQKVSKIIVNKAKYFTVVMTRLYKKIIILNFSNF